jgi:hypothetical protein
VSKQITLHAWASARFDPVPHEKTLRRWARDLKIYPYPEKVGRSYLVIEDAIYIGNNFNKIAEYEPKAA